MNMKYLAVMVFGTLSFFLPAHAYSDENNVSERFTAPPAKLALALNRGICIDRQFRSIPPDPRMRITREDVRLVKSMGFEFVKLIVNPEPLMSDGRLNSSRKWYLKEIVDLVIKEELPVVVCIHPEREFKNTLLGKPDEFLRFLGFLKDTGRFLAANWEPKQLALQLMTEPITNGMDWNDLQPRMWRVARRAMPGHALILAGDQVGKIEGLIKTKPVNDENVLYSFTFYDPMILTQQGGEWLSPQCWSHLGYVPYPSSPQIIADRMDALLKRIPTSPSDWRPAVKGMLVDYGNARWNRDRLDAAIEGLASWNKSYGGGLKIWCAEFGCYHRTINPIDRYRYIRDVRETFEKYGIGWAYWSYNETFTVMTSDRKPFGPAKSQTPDKKMLEALFGRKAK